MQFPELVTGIGTSGTIGSSAMGGGAVGADVGAPEMRNALGAVTGVLAAGIMTGVAVSALGTGDAVGIATAARVTIGAATGTGVGAVTAGRATGVAAIGAAVCGATGTALATIGARMNSVLLTSAAVGGPS